MNLKVLALCVFLMAPFGGAYAAEEPYGPFNLQSGKVISDSSKGKTAHRDQCYEATTDRFFKENSWKADVISQSGKNTSCAIYGIERRSVMLRNGDLEVPVSLPYKFCVSAHAETGSGVPSIGRTAWIECNVSGVLLEFKK